MVQVDSQDGIKQSSPSGAQAEKPAAPQGKKRTRTGCLNCRRKRRKCDEKKPTCEGCRGRREVCQWGMKVSWRPENAQSMGAEHPSMRQSTVGQRPQSFQIVNVTREVIRDYFEETTSGEPLDMRTEDFIPLDPPALSIQPSQVATVSPSTSVDQKAHSKPRDSLPSATTITSPTGTNMSLPFPTSPEIFISPKVSDSYVEDGIFLPGSQYQELHATLRSRLIDTARSTVPSRAVSPVLDNGTPRSEAFESLEAPADDDDESRRLAHLTPEQEYVLWQNYINEVASWLDKFDNERHFELVLPIMAKSNPHLKYSILALSARQMERVAQKQDSSCSLALYQHAIHLLSPLLHKRTTVVLASCIVLCVLEMLSCSPKAWRRHLDGCAALIQALNISGSSGSSLEQALFWIFARMDICGGLISSEKTLIPVSRWLGGEDMVTDVAMLSMANAAGRFDMYANHIVYLCGQVVEMLCSSGRWEQHSQRRSNVLDILDYNRDWIELFDLIEQWYSNRPEEMKPLLTIPTRDGDTSKPFSTILFPNGPAVSGNQMYHTAALLMLKFKPSHISFTRSPPTIMWHARQVCAISISNDHHGCWTNSIQPLWIAGQQMSQQCEHKSILEILQRIEHETGWSTKWRQTDLLHYWAKQVEGVHRKQ